MVTLGTATPGGGFPVYGQAVAETINTIDPSPPFGPPLLQPSAPQKPSDTTRIALSPRRIVAHARRLDRAVLDASPDADPLLLDQLYAMQVKNAAQTRNAVSAAGNGV